MCTNDQLKAAYALNLCTVSIAQIVDYNDIGVLMQEYDNILNNLNIEKMPKDDALLEIFERIIDTINSCYISAEDKKLIDAEYQNRMKNAVWSAVPHLGLIFATGNPIAIAMNLATQVGISYMNYRRNKAEYQQGREREYWQIEKSDLEMISGLQQSLFGTSWQLAKTYNFPDEYRLTNQQVKDYNSTLLEDDPIKRYNSLSFMKDKFKAYPHFWYQMGSTANSIYRSEDLDISDSTRTMYKGHAIECFEHYRKLNKFNLLRQDAITSAWALEYIDLLDLNDENDREKAKELLEEAEAHAGTAKDVLELCAYAALNLGNYDDAIKLFKFLVNNDYNLEINARILSALLIYNFRDPEKRDSVLSAYENISGVARKYLLPIPSTEEEWANFKPDWAKDEVSAGTANEGLTEGNASVALSDTAAVIKSFKSPSQSAEESVSRVMGWIAAHHGFDKIAVYEVEDYFIMRLLNRGDSVYTAGEGSVSPETIRIDKSTGAVAVDAYVDNSVINDVSEMSWKMPERLFCRGNELYAFDAGIKMFDAATLTGFDLIASKEHLGCDDGNHDVTNRVLNVYKAATSRGYNFSGCENYLAFVSEGILYRYDIENQNCQKLCRTSADSIFATDKGVYLLTRDVPSSWLEFYDYAECKIVRGFSVDSADKVYHVCGDCDFYLGDGPIVKRVHKENDSGTTVTLFSNMASSIVYAYDDCIMYTSNGFLNMLSYTTGKKVTLTSGVVCRKAIDVGVIRHKVKYETIPAGFVRIGKWVYYYEDGRRDLPYRVAIDTPDKVKAVPNYRVLEDAEQI
jgi:hypothetical protein